MAKKNMLMSPKVLKQKRQKSAIFGRCSRTASTQHLSTLAPWEDANMLKLVVITRARARGQPPAATHRAHTATIETLTGSARRTDRRNNPRRGASCRGSCGKPRSRRAMILLWQSVRNYRGDHVEMTDDLTHAFGNGGSPRGQPF